MAGRIPSPRFKQLVHPAPSIWMHHLEIHSLDELDDEVRAWLREAADSTETITSQDAHPDRTPPRPGRP